MRIASLFLLMLLSSCLACQLAAGKTIFDDDWTPPAQTPPAQPPGENAPPPNDTKSGKGETPAAPTSQKVVAPQAVRQPIPAPADQAKSRKLFKEFYKKDLADQSPAGRRALAAKLLEQANIVSDAPADEFVLLMGAAQAAREASDLGLVIRAADALSQFFKADGLRIKIDAATQMALRTPSPAETADNCRNGMDLVEQLVAAEDFDTAVKLLKALIGAEPDADKRSLMQHRQAEVQDRKIAADRLASFMQELKTRPEDPVANLEVGRHLCFVKGDWAHGLPLLAKTNDSKVKTLAAQELKSPKDSNDQMSIADGWWAYGDTLQEPEKTTIQARARDYYRKAIAKLTGLAKIRAEVRLADTSSASPKVASVPKTNPPNGAASKDLQPGLVAQLFQDPDFTDPLKKRIDRQIYFDWQKAGPDPAMDGEKFSIRWTGSLRVPKTSAYTFFASVHNEVRIWIDGQSILSQEKATDTAQVELSLAAGVHSIRVDYRNTGGEAHLMLEWQQLNGFPRQGLGRDALCHDAMAAQDAVPAVVGWRSEMIYTKHEGTPFWEAAPPHTVLVGFELTKYKPRSFVVVKSVRAIYRGPGGDVMGAQFGKPEGPVQRIEAKPGYAVGVLRGNYGLRIDRMMIHFMRLDGDKLGPNGSYDSPYFGGKSGGRITDAGDGKPIIGIYGVANDVECCSLGVITAD